MQAPQQLQESESQEGPEAPQKQVRTLKKGVKVRKLYTERRQTLVQGADPLH